MSDAAQHQVRVGRLGVGQRIAPRVVKSVRGEQVRIPDPARLVHLQFRRFAGCPICNLHLQSIAKRYGEIVDAGVIEVAVFHTSAEQMAEHADLPFHVIPDPSSALYREFGVESSPRAILALPFWAALARGMLRSEPRPSMASAAQGGALGLPADFLLSADGDVLARKYGEHADDQWTVDELLSLTPRSRGA